MRWSEDVGVDCEKERNRGNGAAAVTVAVGLRTVREAEERGDWLGVTAGEGKERSWGLLAREGTKRGRPWLRKWAGRKRKVKGECYGGCGFRVDMQMGGGCQWGEGETGERVADGRSLERECGSRRKKNGGKEREGEKERGCSCTKRAGGCSPSRERKRWV